ncbi:MAG: penicillin-binding protein 2 [Porticoccaceae bacterium]|nr:penicillin-binding protein 2 [Porticoccaceae bacterium]MBT7374853.1 penicillin-binding protein 2 [Porticoccaceae bacterium]
MRDDAAFIDPARERRIFSSRLLISAFAVALLFTIIVWRYVDLQINRHQDFATHSDNNRVHTRPAAPARGLIYDRNGELLADNRPAYNLSIVRERTQDLALLLEDLSQLITISEEDIKRFEKRLKRRKPFEPTALKFKLTEEERSILAVNAYRLSGAEISAQLTRHYPKAELFAHVVGYVGRINDREIQRIDPVAYSGTDSIGKIGLEKHYEEQLLGLVGNEHVETNARGRVMRVLEQVDPVPGANLTMHLDSNLQKLAHEAFQGERGALVALDIKTGGVLSMVSAPSYDPNLFVSGISQKNYSKLLNSSDRPMFNRAIRGQYPPGSTIKPLFGLIGLHKQTITMDYRIEDPGYFYMEGIERPWRDHNSDRGGHGNGVDLAKAIIESCDVFFYNMGIRTGIDLLSSYGEVFGLGTLTGIDVPGERRGIMPSREWKKNARQQSWFNGDTINASIGQGFMLTTPLQLAVMSARIASKGKMIQPRLVKSINGVPLEPPKLEESISIDDRYWDYIHRAMRDVVHSPRGTAKGISKGLDYEIAGKTGTAQVISINAEDEYDSSKLDKSQWDHALFVAFAPLDDPQIAVGLIVENGEHGSSVAAPIAQRVIDAYLKSKPAFNSQLVANQEEVRR